MGAPIFKKPKHTKLTTQSNRTQIINLIVSMRNIGLACSHFQGHVNFITDRTRFFSKFAHLASLTLQLYIEYIFLREYLFSNIVI